MTKRLKIIVEKIVIYGDYVLKKFLFLTNVRKTINLHVNIYGSFVRRLSWRLKALVELHRGSWRSKYFARNAVGPQRNRDRFGEKRTGAGIQEAQPLASA